MTSNDGGTLRVGFDPCVDNVYPLLVEITDDHGYHTCLHIKRYDIDPLMACLWLPMSPLVRMITMTGDCVVKWWSHQEVAFADNRCINGTHLATVLQYDEAVELVGMVRHEMACPAVVSVSDPLAGANKRRDENLNSIFG